MSGTDTPRAEARRQFGLQLRAARTQASLTQQQLAQVVGLQQPEVSGIETGKRTMPTDLIPAAAKACGVEVAFFFEPPAAPAGAA